MKEIWHKWYAVREGLADCCWWHGDYLTPRHQQLSWWPKQVCHIHTQQLDVITAIEFRVWMSNSIPPNDLCCKYLSMLLPQVSQHDSVQCHGVYFLPIALKRWFLEKYKELCSNQLILLLNFVYDWSWISHININKIYIQGLRYHFACAHAHLQFLIP